MALTLGSRVVLIQYLYPFSPKFSGLELRAYIALLVSLATCNNVSRLGDWNGRTTSYYTELARPSPPLSNPWHGAGCIASEQATLLSSPSVRLPRGGGGGDGGDGDGSPLFKPDKGAASYGLKMQKGT